MYSNNAVLEVVDELNELLAWEENKVFFTAEISYSWQMIKMYCVQPHAEIVLYNSENNTKENNEPLLDYVVRELKGFISTLNSNLNIVDNEEE